jgi:hypothetical protein
MTIAEDAMFTEQILTPLHSMTEEQEAEKNQICYLCHSLIPSYPPPYNLFPRFYSARERIFILEPGCSLFIPRRWCHWVFSYPSSSSTDLESANIAISFPVTSYNGKVLSPFDEDKPVALKLTEEPFLNWDVSTFLSDEQLEDDELHDVLYSKGMTLHTVKKKASKGVIHQKSMTKRQLVNLVKEGKHNVSLGQNKTLLSKVRRQESKPPDFWLGSMGDCRISTNIWLTWCRSEMGVDTGLHYDWTHGLLVQIKGTKVVRLYAPEEHENLYIGVQNGNKM